MTTEQLKQAGFNQEPHFKTGPRWQITVTNLGIYGDLFVYIDDESPFYSVYCRYGRKIADLPDKTPEELIKQAESDLLEIFRRPYAYSQAQAAEPTQPTQT